MLLSTKVVAKSPSFPYLGNEEEIHDIIGSIPHPKDNIGMKLGEFIWKQWELFKEALKNRDVMDVIKHGAA